MAIYDILYTRLTAHAGLSALIGDRAYPLLIPQSSPLPALTYQMISSPVVGETLTIYNPRYQISCWADGYISAHAVATQVIAALDGFTDTDDTPQLKATLQDDRRDVYDPETDHFGVLVDFLLLHV